MFAFAIDFYPTIPVQGGRRLQSVNRLAAAFSLAAGLRVVHEDGPQLQVGAVELLG
jgi:hypothetical protein